MSTTHERRTEINARRGSRVGAGLAGLALVAATVVTAASGGALASGSLAAERKPHPIFHPSPTPTPCPIQGANGSSTIVGGWEWCEPRKNN